MSRKSLAVAITFLFATVAGAQVQQQIDWGSGAGPYDYADGTVNKFGYNNDVDTAEESLWDMNDLPTAGLGPPRCFTNMAAAADLYVSSDDIADATLEIAIEVLDANYVLSTVTMALGAVVGTGTVFEQIGSATLLRVNRAYATGTGFTGNIYIHLDDVDGDTNGIPDAPATDIVAGITAGENQTLQACYTVPAGFTANITSWCISNVSQLAVGTAVTFRARGTLFGTDAARTQNLLTIGNETTVCTPVIPYNTFPEKTDIEATGSDASNQGAAATFGILLIRN